MVLIKTFSRSVCALFHNWQETLIWSCLQGVMGELYADNKQIPQSAMALIGDFCFLAGVPNCQFLLSPQIQNRNFTILVPQKEDWSRLIESYYPHRATRTLRYAIKKEPNIFDREHLVHAASTLPKGYSVKMIDETLFSICQKERWSRDLVSQFPDYPSFSHLGLGAAVVKDNIPVSGASSYARYRGGIEIEVDTHPEHRRKGFAYACSAALIIACLDRGLYPSWDAQNLWSVALAKKLGYHFDREYPVYELMLPQEN